MDPQLENPQTLGAQVLRLDSPTGSWAEDQNFIQVATNRSGNKAYQAIAALGKAHFDHDYEQKSDYAGRRPHGRILEH